MKDKKKVLEPAPTKASMAPISVAQPEAASHDVTLHDTARPNDKEADNASYAPALTITKPLNNGKLANHGDLKVGCFRVYIPRNQPDSAFLREATCLRMDGER